MTLWQTAMTKLHMSKGKGTKVSPAAVTPSAPSNTGAQTGVAFAAANWSEANASAPFAASSGRKANEELHAEGRKLLESLNESSRQKALDKVAKEQLIGAANDPAAVSTLTRLLEELHQNAD